MGKILDKTQIDAIKSELTRWEEIESWIEILFIIDDTKSMQDWFSIVGAQLENILKTAQTDRTKKVRIAVSYYNDITGTNEVPFAAHPLVDIVDSGRGIIKQLRDHKETDGGDALEMVHRGIVEALDKAKFSQHAARWSRCRRLRDIRHSPKRMEEDKEYSKKYNAQAIVERLLKKGDSPVEFYAIHALQQDRMPNEDTKAYETDMNEIIKEYETRLVSLKMEGNAECFPSSMVVKAPEAIENQFKRLLEQRSNEIKTIKLLMAGKFKEAKPSQGSAGAV